MTNLTERWGRAVKSAVTLALGAAGLAAVLGARPAHAAAPYQGLYVVIDPYGPVQLANLQSAAATPCSGQQTVTTPFCGAANGILLRIPWCDFQLYHVKISGKSMPSCHYVVGYNQSGSGTVEIPSTDTISPCPGSYDICSGRSQSVLGTALRYITQINKQRAAAALPPLNLSVGMFAGIGTPQTIFDTLGYVDVPHNTSAALTPSLTQCYRLPLAWNAQFISSYEKAVDQLFAYIVGQMPQGANIVIAKPAGITATDLEVEQPGQNTFIAAPADPGPGAGGVGGPGPALTCPTSAPGAQVWLNAYNQSPVAGENFSQASESAFGAFIGHEMGMLANLGLSNVLISVPTTNGSGFAYVNCGVSGASACAVNGTGAPWSTYYLEKYVGDLFNGGLAYAAAAAAYGQIRTDTFSLSPTQFSMNSTDLAQTAPVSSQEIPCIMNNTNPANAPSDFLNGGLVPIYGVGLAIGWQTNTNEGSGCAATGSPNPYMQTLQNGINEGSLFEEVETDAAFGSIAQCSPYLSSALTQLLATAPPTSCVF